ncbi:MAG: ATP-binding protein [Helicobacteraceae bacterium]|nr:ATP-binding protein [Helicobacteraceae bacterium]
MQRKIFYLILLTTLSLAMFINIFLFFSLDSFFKKELFNSLKSYANSIKSEVQSTLETNTPYFIENSDFRVSIIDSSGFVIFDNYTKASKLENHKDRVEIAKAHENGDATSIRYSQTMLQHTLYYALKIPANNTFYTLRVAKEQNYIYKLFDKLLPYFLLELFLVIIFCLLVSKYLTHFILKPFSQVDLMQLNDNFPYPEIQNLLDTIKEQKKNIKNKFKHLEQKKQELESLTQNINDGLILINRGGKILNTNAKAKSYFENLSTITHIFKIKNEAFLEILIESLKAFKKGKIRHDIRSVFDFKNSQCEIIFSPIFSQKAKFKGVLIVLCDITEIKKMQNLSKEFSANVTHELKTPLTSILGSAEMIKNKLVAQENIPHFIDKIYLESKRLLELIEDVLRLSFLDESQEKQLKLENINLAEIILKVCKNLEHFATQHRISIQLDLEESTILGVKELLENAIYNLCDNAIKYNNDGGFIKIILKNLSDKIELQIIDSGIGIPQDALGRVFERFFCVDKSRSKKVGGTGLGLSIVKSALSLHNATISLFSEVGKGSKFHIIFKKAES